MNIISVPSTILETESEYSNSIQNEEERKDHIENSHS